MKRPVVEIINRDYGSERVMEALGYLPHFLDEDNPDNCVKQLDQNYKHGGGWSKFEGFKMNMKDNSIKYPGDPPYRPLAKMKIRNETVFVYPHAWVAVVQEDGSYEIARMD